MESEEEEDKNIARRRKVSLVTKHGGVANVLKIVKAPLINVTLDDWSDKSVSLLIICNTFSYVDWSICA